MRDLHEKLISRLALERYDLTRIDALILATDARMMDRLICRALDLPGFEDARASIVTRRDAHSVQRLH
jgi:hypothetical protein